MPPRELRMDITEEEGNPTGDLARSASPEAGFTKSVRPEAGSDALPSEDLYPTPPH